MLQDLRFATRLLLKDRSFALTCVLTLAVCIGANTAIFSIVRSVVLKPLPVPNSDRIMLVYNSYPNAGGGEGGSAGVPDYFDRVQGVSAFAEQALYRQSGVTLGGADGAERLSAVRATPSFYTLVKAQPVVGRTFLEKEGEEGEDKEAILSYALWQKAFAGDASVTAHDIRLGGTNYHIVGVMPREFRFVWADVDVWLPEAFTAKQKSDDARHNNNYQEIGLLKAAATREQAQQQVDAINRVNDDRFPEFRTILHDAGFHTVVVPLQENLVRQIRPVLYLLWGGVVFVLLIGCVNIANLVLVRSNGRSREIATRYALGADRRRLARQLLTETMLLSIVGGVCGVVLGAWALRSVPFLHLDKLPRGFEIQMDWASAGVMLAITLVVGVLIGLVPVARLSRMNVNSTLRQEGRSGTSARETSFVRSALATAQVAVAFGLLLGAGLLVASFREVLRINPGFDASGVLTAAISLPQTAYKDDAAVVTFLNRALDAVRAVPGVQAAGATDSIPMGDDYSDSVILAEGYQMQPGESLISPNQIDVSDGFLEAMHMSLVRGRAFTSSDTATSTRVALIDERLAAKFWPGRDPIGRRLYSPTSAKDLFAVGPNTKYITVVGVLREVQLTGLGSAEKKVGAYYFPLSQSTSHGFILALRTNGDPLTVVPALRQAIARLDPELPVYRVRTMTARVDESLLDRRVPMLLATGFGIVALLLSAIGIYGVLASGVAQRRREIGIRLALGSTTRQIFGLVLGDGARIVGIGLAIGLAGALAGGRLMNGLLYGVRAADPVVIGMAIATLAIVGFLAIVIPARRATKVSPIVALSE